MPGEKLIQTANISLAYAGIYAHGMLQGAEWRN